MLLLLTEEIQLPANMFQLLQSFTSILSQKNKLSRFLDHPTLTLSNYIFTGHLPLPPQTSSPKKIVAPVTGDLSLKSRNLSLKAGSLREMTAEAVSTKMVDFVPQQKHMDTRT